MSDGTGYRNGTPAAWSVYFNRRTDMHSTRRVCAHHRILEYIYTIAQRLLYYIVQYYFNQCTRINRQCGYAARYTWFPEYIKFAMPSSGEETTWLRCSSRCLLHILIKCQTWTRQTLISSAWIINLSFNWCNERRQKEVTIETKWIGEICKFIQSSWFLFCRQLDRQTRK